jgi:hypothetical protein
LRPRWTPIFVFVVACKRDAVPASSAPDAASGGEVKASCDKIAAMGICSEHTELEIETRGDYALKNGCEKLRGTWTSGRCPNTSVLGVCRIATGELRSYYATGGVWFNESKAKSDCESMGGAWLAKK